MARQKKTIISGVSREAMEEAFRAYAAADARQRSLTAEMDGRLTEIREGYADRLTSLENEKKEAFDMMQSYAVENREQLFRKRRSIETTHGVLGFRTGTPKLKVRKGLTWAGVLELLKVKAPSYLRQTVEVAKDRLLAERESEDTRAIMDACCIDVVQDETFYVEPKSEAAD